MTPLIGGALVVGAGIVAGVAVYRWWRRPRLAQLGANGTMRPVERNAMQHSSPIESSETIKRSNRLIALPIVILLILIAFTLSVQGNYRVAATLGIVQGLGEFLPISSSAHLIVTPWLFGWTDETYGFFTTQTFDVALHMGTLLALIILFWRDWVRLVLHAHQPKTQDGKLFWLLVLASVPGAAVGAILETFAEGYFGDKYLLIAGTLSIMGLLLYWADHRMPERIDLHEINWKTALLIGTSQALALVPGVSRSGSTMTMGRALGLKRTTAARFSFLMATPITFGAGLLKLRKLSPADMTPPFWLGIVVAFIVGMLAITFLLRFLQRKGNSFLPFALYRLGLAAVIAVVYFVRYR